MNRFFSIVSVLLLTTSSVAAQSATLRGEVTDLPGSPRRFVVEGAPSLRLTSTQVNLASLYDAGNFALTVRPVAGPTTSTTLEVLQARRLAERFEIDGGLRIGQTAIFTVTGQNGARAAAFITPTSRTGFLPIPGAGTWLLGSDAVLIGQRNITGGEREFFVPVPNDPSLVGLRLTAQGAVIDGNNLFLTDPDVATIRN